MAKKMIKDLKIDDIVWRYTGSENPEPLRITKLGTRSLEIDDGYKYDYLGEDKTRFNFSAKRYSYEHQFYLEKIDALKAQRKALDENLESIFKKQEDFYEKVSEANSMIRACDAIIVEELLK